MVTVGQVESRSGGWRLARRTNGGEAFHGAQPLFVSSVLAWRVTPFCSSYYVSFGSLIDKAARFSPEGNEQKMQKHLQSFLLSTLPE
jgi:hypothetical protein